MKHKLRVILVLVVILALLVPATALAGSGQSSSTMIQLNQTGASGPSVPMYGTAWLQGWNGTNATNSLYIKSSGLTVKSYLVDIGGVLGNSSFSISTGDYRIKLDPKGLGSGCAGGGTLSNP